MIEHALLNVSLDVGDNCHPDPAQRIKSLMFTRYIPVPLDPDEPTTDENGMKRTFKLVPFERWIVPLKFEVCQKLGPNIASSLIVNPGDTPEQAAKESLIQPGGPAWGS